MNMPSSSRCDVVRDFNTQLPAWPVSMPRRKVRCTCCLCRSCLDPVDHRTAKSHIAKYGSHNWTSPSKSVSNIPILPHVDNGQGTTKQHDDHGRDVGQVEKQTTHLPMASDPTNFSTCNLELEDTDVVPMASDPTNSSNLELEDSEVIPMHMTIVPTKSSILELEGAEVERMVSDDCMMIEPDEFECAGENTHLDSPLSSTSSSDEEFDNDESEFEVVNDHNIDDTWSFTYDKTLYTKGIACEMLPGSNISVLQWLAMSFYTFSSHSMSKKSFSCNLNIQKILYTSNKDSSMSVELPSNYREARKMVNQYIVKKINFKCCVNDCIVYKGNEGTNAKCPMCDSTKMKNFVYLPIAPRIARIYGEKNLAKLVQAHGHRLEERFKSDMWDIQDSPAWHEVYGEDGYFKGDYTGLSFAFEADGVSPYHNLGISYSMTPIMLTLLNLPRNVRNLFGNIMLVGIVPGTGRSEALKLDPYLEIMVDELLYLTECQTIDSYKNAPVNVKIKVLMFVLDYPGLSKLFCQHGSGSLAGCHWCFVRGQHCKHLDKVIYLSNRSYLASNDPLRLDDKHFLCKKTDFSVAPRERKSNEEKNFRHAYDTTDKIVNKKLVATATGCKSSYVLEKLTGHDRVKESIPDACHTIKDLVQNIMNLLVRKSDVKKISDAEFNLGRVSVNIRTDNQIQTDHGINTDAKKRKTCPEIELPYVLTNDEIERADRRAKNIRVPHGFGLKPSPFISKNRGALKSHDWKQIDTHGILKYCLRGCLSVDCRTTLFALLDSISQICSESVCIDDLEEMERDLNKALALLERDFPLSLQNITTHIFHHIVNGIRRYGPVYGTWMYNFERFNSWICKRVFNKRHPEATVMETFAVFDWCNFMISTGRMPSDMVTMTNLQFNDDLECQEIKFDDNNEPRYDSGIEITLSGRELNILHHVLAKEGIVCPGNCTIRKASSYKVTHLETGRCIYYTAAAKSGRISAHTKSCYVCFETNRGKPNRKLSTGQFVNFGIIVAFYHHVAEDGRQVTVSCVETYTNSKCDVTKLWKCPIDSEKSKQFIHVKKLSKPLVTAEEDGCLWFLNSGKIPFNSSINKCRNVVYGNYVK